MRAGQLRHRITLETRTTVPDDMGGNTVAYVVAAVLWADVVKDTTSRQLVEARKLNAKASHRVTLRHRAVDPVSQRFVYGGEVLDILTADDPDGTRVQLVCICEASTDGN